MQQIAYLESVCDSFKTVELRVLPFSRSLVRTPMHHFVIYDERTVEIEVNKGQLDLWTEEDVQYHIELMNYLVSVSLAPSQSKELLAAIRQSISLESIV